MAPSHFQTVWVLTDGKIGDHVQCRGIARHLRGAKVTEHVVSPKGVWGLPFPFMPVPPKDAPHQPNSPIAPPFPNLILASGRRTIPYLREVKKRAPKTAIVFLKDPRWVGRSVADFIWAPVHDALPSGSAKTLSTHTSPHGLDETAKTKALERANTRFSALRNQSADLPVTGLILGGDSGTVKWNAQTSQDLANKIASALPANAPLLVTQSRRTPAILLDTIKRKLPASNAVWYDDGSENAYVQILVSADRLIVTGDSHNMVSEALSTGSPVYAYRPEGLQPKLGRFLDAMEMQGAVRSFEGTLPPFDGVLIDSTPQIARKLAEELL